MNMTIYLKVMRTIISQKFEFLLFELYPKQ